MTGFDAPLIVAWTIAAISLGLQVYLLTTWPTSSRGTNPMEIPNLERPSRSRRPRDPKWDEDLGDWLMQSPRPTSGSTKSAATASMPLGKGTLTLEPSVKSTRRKPRAAVTLKQRVVRAGLYNPRSAHAFELVRLLMCVTAFCVGLLIAPLVSLSWMHGLIFGAAAALAGYLSPSFWLDRQLRVRQTTMRRALPDALDLITVCMQGGLSLPASLVRVAQELGTAHPLLAAELGIVEREIQMGRTTGDALRQFANRFDLEELRSLASVVSQAEKFGGSIIGALRTYAEGLRIKRRQRAEEMAQKAAVKLLFPTLLCIFPGIFIVILGPTAIRIYEVMVVANPWGQ